MKRINYKKIFVLFAWTLATGGLLLSLAFVSKSERDVRVNKLNIKVENNHENVFLTENDVRTYLQAGGKSLMSVSYSSISIPEIEKVLNAHPAIENAEVAAEMSGELHIRVRQRTPLCRIINMDGESYYIDSQSRLMPLNENYTARVIVASGYIAEPFSRRYQFSVDEIGKNKIFSEVSVLDDVLRVVKYVNADSTLLSLIHQVYVTADRDIELYPAVGNHRIVFGPADQLEEKFNKLKLFYTQGLNKTDGWNRYSSINLKYKNLVVCTKK